VRENKIEEYKEHHQAVWPENCPIADYFARLSYVLSEGRRVVDILVIHPIGSAWALYRPGATYRVDQFDVTVRNLVDIRDHSPRAPILGENRPCASRSSLFGCRNRGFPSTKSVFTKF
jgi:hypothetical protein